MTRTNAKFDMDACIKERKEADRAGKHFKHTEGFRIPNKPKVSVAPELSSFGTRVVLNEVLNGKPVQKAVERAISLSSKKEV